MSNQKHTPGPWFVDDTWGLITADNGIEIAACHSGIKANSYLLAAAPDLLAALGRIVDECTDLTFDQLCLAKDALRKATGGAE